jgi:hypothetical protein
MMPLNFLSKESMTVVQLNWKLKGLEAWKAITTSFMGYSTHTSG